MLIVQYLWGLLVQLVEGLGWYWALAAGLEFLAIVVEGAAKKRIDEPGSEPHREGIAGSIMLVLSGLATVFLFVHVVFHSSLAYVPALRFLGMGIVGFVVVFGSIVGYALGSASPNAYKLAGPFKLPMAILAFGITVFATLPSIDVFMTLIAHLF